MEPSFHGGAGLTLACGTGAAAAIVTGNRKGLLDRQCRVDVTGGELKVDWREEIVSLGIGSKLISIAIMIIQQLIHLHYQFLVSRETSL